MTPLERRILEFVSGTNDVNFCAPTRSAIYKAVCNTDAPHAVNALWEAGFIEAPPVRKPKAAIRFQITSAGREIMRAGA